VISGGGTPAAGQKSVIVSLTMTSGFEMTFDVSIEAGTETTFYKLFVNNNNNKTATDN